MVITEFDKRIEIEALNPPDPYMPKTEWESRIKKARGLMENKGLDAILILNNQNRRYFFGKEKIGLQYPTIGIIPRQGPTTVVSSSEDADMLGAEGYAERDIGYRGSTVITEKSPDEVKLITEVMEDLGLTNKTLGMEFGRFMWWGGFTMNEWEQFKRNLPNAKFVDATDLIWEMRTIKTDWELGVLRKLHQATIRGYHDIINNAGAGKNERELFYGALRIWMDEGIIDSTPDYRFNVFIAGGRFGPSAPKMGRGQYMLISGFRDRILEEGDYFLVDGGPSYKGYTCDIQRMVWIGEPGEEVRRMAHAAWEGQKAAVALLRPGAKAGDLYTAAFNRVAEDVPGIWYKMRSRKTGGYCGHGVGLNLHEPVYLCEGSDEVIKEGMTINIEISSVHPDKRLLNMPEDNFLVTKDGCVNLTEDLGPGDIYIKT